MLIDVLTVNMVTLIIIVFTVPVVTKSTGVLTLSVSRDSLV